jgi:anti-sigma28 factor (negative regulator of flagellin synthesis)
MHRNATLLLKGAARKRATRQQGRDETNHTVSGGQERARAPGSQEGIRHGLVARVRAEIASGAYDTEEKLHAALERMMRRLGE